MVCLKEKRSSLRGNTLSYQRIRHMWVVEACVHVQEHLMTHVEVITINIIIAVIITTITIIINVIILTIFILNIINIVIVILSSLRDCMYIVRKFQRGHMWQKICT